MKGSVGLLRARRRFADPLMRVVCTTDRLSIFLYTGPRQDGNVSSRAIPQVKHLELTQFSVRNVAESDRAKSSGSGIGLGFALSFILPSLYLRIMTCQKRTSLKNGLG